MMPSLGLHLTLYCSYCTSLTFLKFLIITEIKKDEPTHWINEWIRPNVDSFFLIIAALPCIVMYCDVKSWCTFDVNDVQTPYFFWSIRPLFVRKKPLFTFDHLVCFFQISLDIIPIIEYQTIKLFTFIVNYYQIPATITNYLHNNINQLLKELSVKGTK